MSGDYLKQIVGKLKAEQQAEQAATEKENRESKIKAASGPKFFQELRQWLKSTTDAANAQMGQMVIEYKDSETSLELRKGGTDPLASKATAQLNEDDSINYQTVNPNINAEPQIGIFRPVVVNGGLQYKDSANKSASVEDIGKLFIDSLLGL